MNYLQPPQPAGMSRNIIYVYYKEYHYLPQAMDYFAVDCSLSESEDTGIYQMQKKR